MSHRLDRLADRTPRRLVALLAGALALTCAVAAPQRAHAVETIIQDDAQLLHRSDDEVRASMAQIRSLGIDRVRLTAGWSVLAPNPDSTVIPDFDATDPAAYPAGNWHNLDRAVRLANDAGLKVMIDIAFWAPRWATKASGSETSRLRTDIDPRLYALFAQAVVKRYSGSWAPSPESVNAQPEPSPDGNFLDKLLGRNPPPPPPPADVPPPPPLPRVSMYTIWNEPNHSGFVMPQWVKRDGEWFPRSAEIYRDMVYTAYPAIKDVDPNVKVLVGGTSSTGSYTPGEGGVPPLRFIRALACVDEQLRPIRTGSCANFQRIPGDGWSHHPYSLRTLPNVVGRNKENLPVAATHLLVTTLRKLVDEGRLSPADADVWMTEYGYETNPPDPDVPFSAKEQGPLLAWAEYIATRESAVKSWPQFLLRDMPGGAAGPAMRAFGDWQSGLFYEDGSPKPAATTFRTPSFATCVRRHHRKWLLIWGKLRGGNGPEHVEFLAAKPRSRVWKAVASSASTRRRSARSAGRLSLRPGSTLKRYVKLRRGVRYRVRWVDSHGTSRMTPRLKPFNCS